MMRAAIIGAGMAGISCAHRLVAHGCIVTLFDKSRGVGGRCATRRTDSGPFDHGAPHFTARSRPFREEVTRWRQVAQVVPGDQPDQWVAVPGMSALPRHLAAGITVMTETPIEAVEPDGAGWRLRATARTLAPQDQRFDAVVVAVPAEQAVRLTAASPAIQEKLETVHSTPCWTVLAAWGTPLPLAARQITPATGPLAIARRDDTRPQRPVHNGAAERWVLHARADWTQAHLEEKPDAIAGRLLAAFAMAIDGALPAPAFLAGHRWRFAQVEQPLPDPFGWDARLRLGSCGDAWHGAGNSEGFERAWLSGAALADAMLASREGCPGGTPRGILSA